jgi:glycosyltransferase involved in cell wall biosynthesis
MKVLQVYNDYRSNVGGEAGVVRMIAATLERHGDEAQLLTRSSKGLDNSFLSKIQCFISGIYNRSAYREMAALLEADRPDVVHAHNLYPLFSPSVLVACRRADVPVVMTTHNYQLTCPIVSHLRKGKICEKCMGGNEQWSVLNNCRGSFAESLAYGLRSYIARKKRYFLDNVTIQVVLSDFARERLIRAGYDPRRVVVLPNMTDLRPMRNESTSGTSQNLSLGGLSSAGQFAAFCGRMQEEKGVDVLLAAAARLPEVPVRLAGDGPILEALMAAAPPNADFVKRIPPDKMMSFYKDARFLVVPSMWFEGHPLVITEAMSHGLPVIASRIGGLPEFVEDGVTGLLFEPGNVDDLVDRMRTLWENPELCKRMGKAGREKAEREYGEELFYQRLMAIYQKAIDLTPKRKVYQGRVAERESVESVS